MTLKKQRNILALIGVMALVASVSLALTSFKDFTPDLFGSEHQDLEEMPVAHLVLDINDSEEQIDEAIEKSQHSQTFGNLTFETRFIPAVFFARRELRGAPDTAGVLENYKKNAGFLLRVNADKFQDELLKYQLGSVNEYYHRIEYYSFQVQNDIHLVLNEKDTVACSFHHFERNYGIGPEIRLMTNFPVTENELFAANKVQIIWNDRVFKNGPVKFLFNRSQFTQIEFSNE